MNIDEKTLDLISDCWVKYRHTIHVSELNDCCKYVICRFLTKIAEDDREFAESEEFRGDIEYCKKEVKG
mgnify:CR=1 FL=1